MGSNDFQPYGHGYYMFMYAFKLVLGLEGLVCIVTALLYIAGLMSYNNDLMNKPFYPERQYLPYLPVEDSSNDLTDTSFYYSHSARSQLACGVVTVLHVAVAFVVACCIKKKLWRSGIMWTIAGFVNTVAAVVAIAYTWTENSDSGREYPNVSQSEIRYWVYGHYSAETWVCGDGKDLVGLKQAGNNYNPLGGQGAVDDFQRYCTEAKVTKYVCIIILITSIVMILLGIFAFFRGRRALKQGKAGTANAIPETAPPVAEYGGTYGGAYGSYGNYSGAPANDFRSGSTSSGDDMNKLQKPPGQIQPY